MKTKTMTIVSRETKRVGAITARIHGGFVSITTDQRQRAESNVGRKLYVVEHRLDVDDKDGNVASHIYTLDEINRGACDADTYAAFHGLDAKTQASAARIAANMVADLDMK